MPNPVTGVMQEIPFAELVRQAALAVADGQTALDMNSIQTAQVLAETKLPAGSVVMALIEHVNDAGDVIQVEPLYNDVEMPLLVYGLEPTFYHFTETTIELKFTARYYVSEVEVERRSDLQKGYQSSYFASNKKYGGGGGLSLNLGFFSISGGGGYSKTETNRTFQSTLQVSTFNEYHSQVYSFSVQGAARLTTTLKPKPGPSRFPEVRRLTPEAPPAPPA
ncbi:MAG: hypothetical protein GXO75_14845 [Calditrichaeota bacterium]|nr:hypothetical protein [Calditrichota bacterium]